MSGPRIDDLEAEVERVRMLGKAELRSLWRSTFGTAPPPALSKDLLARKITWHLQEKALGGLDTATAKLLAKLARGERPGEVRRRLKPGTVLVREYRGERHIVTVVRCGFEWNGAIYASLSTIARAITSTSWNGPRFFGLRVPGEQDGGGGEPRSLSRNSTPARSAPHPKEPRENRG